MAFDAMKQIREMARVAQLVEVCTDMFQAGERAGERDDIDPRTFEDFVKMIPSEIATKYPERTHREKIVMALRGGFLARRLMRTAGGVPF